MKTTTPEASETFKNVVEKWDMDFTSSFRLPKNNQEYDLLCEFSYQLSKLLEKGAQNSTNKNKITSILDIIHLIIDDYDKKHFKFRDATPIEVLTFLMEQNNLKQVDLANEIGQQSVVSQILSGRRSITAKMARSLGERFHTSPALFI